MRSLNPGAPAPWKLAIAVSLALITVVAFALGSLPIGIAAAVFGLCVLQGLWRGGSELVGLVVGMLLAVLLAVPIGKALSPFTSALIGTSGLTNRFLSMAIAAALITAACTLIISIAAKRLMKQHESWKRWDPLAGAALGSIEGSLLAMLVLWVPLALAPIARSQLEAAAADAVTETPPGEPVQAPPSTSLASTIVEMGDQVRSSVLGPVAQATNPVAGSQVVVLASDFAAVSRDSAAMDHLLNTAVMKEIQEMPSLVQAMERIRQDQELAKLVDRGGVSVEAIRTVMTSDAFLSILDTTSVIADLTPLAERLAKAITEAKATIGSGAPPPPQ